MEGAWHVVLRDILVILSAVALVLASVFSALIAWQLYRMARQLQADVEPVVGSLQKAADTVRDTSGFVGGGGASPALGAIGVASGVKELYGLARQFYRGQRRGEGKGDQDTGGM